MLKKKLKPIKYILKRYADFFFFCLFVLCIPFEKRHIFNLDQARINSTFLEWKAYSLYLSDIVFILFIVFWLVRLFILHFEKTKFQYKIIYQKIKSIIPLYILSAFTICLLISLLNSQYLNISIYRTIKIFQGLLLFIYIYKTISTYRKIFVIIYTFIFTALIQAFVGIYQYFAQHSLGLHILGEPIINPNIQNVAKIVINGEKHIRAYGTMPHANILGGFLMIAVIFCICLIILFTLYKPNNKNVSRGTFSKPDSIIYKLFHVEQFPYLSNSSHKVILRFLYIALFLISLGLVLSFSYSAYIALLLGPAILFLFLAIPYMTNYSSLIKKVKLLWKSGKYSIIMIFLIIVFCFIAFMPEIMTKFTNIETVDDFTVVGRMHYMDIAFKQIIKYPEFGTGLGTFPFIISDYSQFYHTDAFWQLNPVHNVLLLVGAELGITCLLLFILLFGWIISSTIINLKQANKLKFLFLSTLISIFVAIFVIMQFDHYFWTIQQGIMTFFLILGLIFTANTKLKRV